MASYIAKLTPTLRHAGTEGSMDTSLVNGVSIQRTGYFEVYNSTNRKIVSVNDGETFTDVIPTWTTNDNITAA